MRDNHNGISGNFLYLIFYGFIGELDKALKDEITDISKIEMDNLHDSLTEDNFNELNSILNEINLGIRRYDKGTHTRISVEIPDPPSFFEDKVFGTRNYAEALLERNEYIQNLKKNIIKYYNEKFKFILREKDKENIKIALAHIMKCVNKECKTCEVRGYDYLLDAEVVNKQLIEYGWKTKLEEDRIDIVTLKYKITVYLF